MKKQERIMQLIDAVDEFCESFHNEKKLSELGEQVTALEKISKKARKAVED
jgi:alcohol dehydrogenase class IV